ncbi:YetF domain-containing protein [Salimicrobium halophilum]|uniref:Uncharacterized membrane protein YcaP, DUF421 family n=1 Tax=Salimicrobium halophilum TaxID=86666 RepID=A0A1G8PLW9_9BACI|nr:DUF421 domain-containing protein [Salimicrobium halophilum]SDI93195.1 Uncharacterized membrane protein YcaP, DUF421 family [Salimicrobium halophilum]
MIIQLVSATFLTYVFVLLVFRLMGKREIGELSVMDLVVFIMIAEIAIILIEEPAESMVKAIVPMITLLLIQRGSALLSLKSEKFRQWFDGKPAFIIEDGKVNEKVMREQRYNFNDLFVQLREKGVQHLADVSFAVLEPSGKLSVFEKDEQGNSGFAYLLICDGKILKDGLKKASVTKEWLMNQLRDRGIMSEEDVSICTIAEDKELYIDRK